MYVKPENKMFLHSSINLECFFSLSNVTASNNIWDKSLEIVIAFGVKSIVCSILLLYT